MRPSLFLAAAATALAAPHAAAQDANSFYLGIGIGLGLAPDAEVDTFFAGGFEQEPITQGSFDQSFDTGASLSFLVGREVSDRLAVEVEFKGIATPFEEIDDFGYGTGAYLANLVYRGGGERIVPYAGVGLGYGELFFIEDEDSRDPGYDGALAYQAKAGAQLLVGRRHAFIGEASYLGSGAFEIGDGETIGAEIDYDGFALTVGYQFRFRARP